VLELSVICVYAHRSAVPVSILDMFPLKDIPAANSVDDTVELEKQVDRLGRVHQRLTVQSAKPGRNSAIVRPGEKYRRYRTKEDVPKTGRLLYKLAGMIR